MTKLKLTCLVIFSILISTCKKESNLPPASQIGANVFAAKINGAVWRDKACWSCPMLDANYDDRSFFGVSGYNNERKLSVTLIIQSLKKVGTYPLKKDSNVAEVNDFNFKDSKKFITSSNNAGEIKISKVDLANKIISGTFNFIAEDAKNPSNTITVTDGRFDVKFD